MGDEFDAYKVLQVDREADPEVIQAAYRRLAQKYHPDVTPGADAADRMIAINRAWEVLRDPERRRAYDRAASSAHTTASTGTARPSPTAASSGPGPDRGPTAGTTARGGSPEATTVGGGAPGATAPPRPPEEVSRDWTSGRSSSGHAYDTSMRTPDGPGAAGPPPGGPSGSVLTFGRYASWSLGEIARVDLDYLEWLDRMPIGRAYRDEIDAILRRVGRRRAATAEAADRRGLYRRR